MSGRVHKTPTLAPMLFPQGNSVHRHAAVYGFAHVVNGKQGDLNSDERFHLYAGGANGFYGGGAAFKRTKYIRLSQISAC